MAHKRMNWMFLYGIILLFIGFSFQSVRAQATITVVNNDGAGEGFNDPTPFTPVGGNPATTLGAAHLYAFQFAANLWGACINSPVTILVNATMDPLSCTANSAVLGSAGATTVHRDFTNAPVANTWYPQALANSLAGFDLSGANADISASFNINIGTTGCLESLSWYLGVDGKAPAGTIDFVTVVLHEIGHGLGFQTFVSLSTGAKFVGRDDTYMLNLEHHGATPSDYPSMTDAQRVAASIADPNLHWTGTNGVTEASAILTGGFLNGHVQMHGPNPNQPGSSVSHFSTALTPSELMEPSYTGPDHSVGLTLPVYQDIGWSINDKSTDTNLPTVSVATVSGGTVTGSFTDNFPLGIVEVKSLTGGAALSVDSQSLVQGQIQSFNKSTLNVTATGSSGARIEVVITDIAGNRRVWVYKFL